MPIATLFLQAREEAKAEQERLLQIQDIAIFLTRQERTTRLRISSIRPKRTTKSEIRDWYYLVVGKIPSNYKQRPTLEASSENLLRLFKAFPSK